MSVKRSNLGSSKDVGSPAEEDVHDGGMTLLGSEVKRRQTVLPAKHANECITVSTKLAKHATDMCVLSLSVGLSQVGVLVKRLNVGSRK